MTVLRLYSQLVSLVGVVLWLESWTRGGVFVYPKTLREISVLKRCSHTNIVRLLEVACEIGPGREGDVTIDGEPVDATTNNSNDEGNDAEGGAGRGSPPLQDDIPRIFLVFEYVKNDLVGILDVIKTGRNPRFSRIGRQEMSCYARQILRAVAYLHRCVSHGTAWVVVWFCASMTAVCADRCFAYAG